MIVCILTGLLPFLVHSQSHRLSGRVVDGFGMAIAGATVAVRSTELLAVTGVEGDFSIEGLPANDYRIEVRKKGYETKTVSVTLPRADQWVSIQLDAETVMLSEVLVIENPGRRRKREESLNVEIVERDFIHRNLGGSLMNTLERLPGIQTIGIGSGQSKPLIRGLGFNRLVVVDNGIKHEGQQWGADHGLEVDQFAVGEVELVKGAASFLYGSDAIAGVVDIEPAPIPLQDTVRGEISLVGKSNNHQYGVSINLGARSGQWFMDGRTTYQQYGDYRVPTDTVHIYDYPVPLHKHRLRNTAGRENGMHLHGGFVGERFRSVIYVSNLYSKTGFFANAHGLEPRRVDAGLHDRSDRDILQPRQNVNHFKAISRTAFTTGRHRPVLELGFQHNFRQEFNNYVNHGYMPPVYPDTLEIPRELEREFSKYVYSVNLRDHITLDKHELSFGANGEFQDNAIGGWSFLVPSFRQVTFGAFVYEKYRLNDRVWLHGAVRYDHGHLRSEMYRDWFPSGEGTDAERLVRSDALDRRFNSLVWSAGLNVNSGKLNLKANIGKSFRMPIAKELAANGVNYHYFSYERGDSELSPEQSYQADATLSWDTERWSVQVSPFFNYFPNYIYLNPTATFDYHYGAGNQVFQYAQSRVMRYGGEAEVTYRFSQQLEVSFLGEYLYAEQLSGDKKGYTLPFSPPPSLLINASWSPRFGGILRNPYLSVDYRLAGKQDRIVPPERKTAGYGVMAVRLGAGIGSIIQVNLQALNLLNARYMNHASFYRLIGLHEASRNIVLSLTVPLTI